MAENYSEFPAFIALVKANKEAIRAAILQDVYKNQTEKLTHKVALGNLVPLIDKIILPYIRRWEKGVSTDANNNAVAVHGVTAEMLYYWFEGIFVTQVSTITRVTPPTTTSPTFPTQTEAENIEASKLIYTTNTDSLDKIIIQAKVIKTTYLKNIASTTLAIHALLADTDVAELFYYYSLTRKDYSYPIAMMAADPYLGFLAADFTWTQGTDGMTAINEATDSLNILGDASLARVIVASNNSMATTPTQPSKLPAVSREAIAQQLTKINKDYPASDTGKALYRQTYLDRFINNPTESTLSYMVIITEKFNKNTLNDYVFTEKEKLLLGNLVVGYENFKITVDL